MSPLTRIGLTGTNRIKFNCRGGKCRAAFETISTGKHRWPVAPFSFNDRAFLAELARDRHGKRHKVAIYRRQFSSRHNIDAGFLLNARGRVAKYVEPFLDSIITSLTGAIKVY